MSTKEDFFTGNIISVGNGIQTYAEITFKNDDGEDIKKLIEMGNITDIITQSQVKIGRIDKNGNNQAQGFQTGTRLAQGKMVISNFDENAISYIEKAISYLSVPNIQNPFTSKDIEIGVTDDITDEKLKNGNISAQIVTSVSLMSLPPINIILVAKADYVRQLGYNPATAEEVSDYKLDGDIKYNNIVIKKIKGIKFSGTSGGIDGQIGLKDTMAEFLILGKDEPWKFLNPNK